MQRNPGFLNWLKESPCLSVGARAFLMQRFGIAPRPRTPFVTVTLFGCALDESAGSNEWPPARVEPGADAPGDAI